MQKQLSAVDLFCGVGGMTHGLIKSGIQVRAGIDIDGTCKYAYEKNNSAKFIEKDIRNLTEKDLSDLYPKGHIKVLVGCAPCQPFSRHTQKNKNRKKDGKWNLLYEFGRLVRGVQPEIVSMENVQKLQNEKVFEDFIETLEESGYFVSYKSVYSPNYGIPQTRLRLVLLASKYGPINLIPNTHNSKTYRTVREFIGHLDKIGIGESSTNDRLHKAANLTPLNIKRIQQSRPGGTWHDWDEELIADCHRKKSGKTYKAVYARMSWNKPGPTITTQFFRFGTGRFGHPEQDRAISLREGALLQTFPRTYKFIEPGQPIIFLRLGIHIGNAVPVRLAEVVGKSIQQHIQILIDSLARPSFKKLEGKV